MITAKCRCSTCSKLSEAWIGDRCLLCYNEMIAAPHKAEIDRLVHQQSSSQIRTKKYWEELKLYENRFSVRFFDWFYGVWQAFHFLFNHSTPTPGTIWAANYFWGTIKIFLYLEGKAIRTYRHLESTLAFFHLLTISGPKGLKNITPTLKH